MLSLGAASECVSLVVDGVVALLPASELVGTNDLCLLVRIVTKAMCIMTWLQQDCVYFVNVNEQNRRMESLNNSN